MMRRSVLIAMCIAGSAALGAQSSTPQGQTVLPGQRVLADRIEKVGTSFWRLRGHVTIIDSATTIVADEVDAKTDSNGVLQLDLRGNVHVSMNPNR
jgi:hypothetical protein